MSLRLKIHLLVGVLVALFIATVIVLVVDNMRSSVREEVVAEHARALLRYGVAAKGPGARERGAEPARHIRARETK